MHWFRFAVLLILATILQASLLDVISVSGTRPDLLLILLVFFAIYRDVDDAIITSFSIGFASDIIGASMGPGILSFGLLGTFLCYLTRFFSIRTMPLQTFVIFIFGFIAAYLSSFLSYFQNQMPIKYLYGSLLGTPLYSAIIGPFLFLPVAWWMHIRTQPTQRRTKR